LRSCTGFTARQIFRWSTEGQGTETVKVVGLFWVSIPVVVMIMMISRMLFCVDDLAGESSVVFTAAGEPQIRVIPD
jgi:hypothetical protein